MATEVKNIHYLDFCNKIEMRSTLSSVLLNVTIFKVVILTSLGILKILSHFRKSDRVV